ncbi:hypothetical protein [Streptomyces sp. NBC_01304]|uniref:hypothetical protein n=1 Tax=Streptomyces sp. NBC_01304 TaxID=2903818 RepID=UPI002E0F4658|nr:hypothetical protein OG430_19430 [Streptomyces sp. NBC_01304]
MAEGSAAPGGWLNAEAVRWVDTDGWPPVCEVVFDDVEGVRHSVIDKTPLFYWDDDEEPGLEVTFPIPVFLYAAILEPGGTGDQVRIGIDHRSVGDDGYAEFTVFTYQIAMETDG